MPNYRRAKTQEGTFFFTVVTYRRRLLFDLAEARTIKRDGPHAHSARLLVGSIMEI